MLYIIWRNFELQNVRKRSSMKMNFLWPERFNKLGRMFLSALLNFISLRHTTFYRTAVDCVSWALQSRGDGKGGPKATRSFELAAESLLLKNFYFEFGKAIVVWLKSVQNFPNRHYFSIDKKFEILQEGTARRYLNIIEKAQVVEYLSEVVSQSWI